MAFVTRVILAHHLATHPETMTSHPLSIITTTDPRAGQLPLLLSALANYASEATLPLEVVVVDDLKAWPNANKHTLPDLKGLILRPVWYPEQRGQAFALLEGIRQAEGELVLTIDPDMHLCIPDIPAMLNKLSPNITIVHGVRRQRADVGWLRLRGSAAANAMVTLLTGIDTPDIGSPIALMRKSSLISALEDASPLAVNPRLYLYGKSERSITTHSLSAGSASDTRSQYSTLDLVRLFLRLLSDCITLRLNKPRISASTRP